MFDIKSDNHYCPPFPSEEFVNILAAELMLFIAQICTDASLHKMEIFIVNFVAAD